MALTRIVTAILDTIESLGDSTADTAAAKLDTIVKIAAVLIGAIVLLIMFALDGTLALILVGLIIVALYLLDVDIGGSSNDGPRR